MKHERKNSSATNIQSVSNSPPRPQISPPVSQSSVPRPTTQPPPHVIQINPQPPPPQQDCMYLHELGEEAASFTKEEMQVGRKNSSATNIQSVSNSPPRPQISPPVSQSSVPRPTTQPPPHVIQINPQPPPPQQDCMYLHELGEEAASFTKEEMQVGRKNSSATNIQSVSNSPPRPQISPPVSQSSVPRPTTQPPPHVIQINPQPPPPQQDCMYLHELGEEAASFTKEEMQVGRKNGSPTNIQPVSNSPPRPQISSPVSQSQSSVPRPTTQPPPHVIQINPQPQPHSPVLPKF